MEDTLLTLTIINMLLLILLGVCFVIFNFYSTEIKSFFSRIRLFRRKRDEDLKFIMNFINDLASVLIKMSTDKIGSLIVIENKDSLTPYINIGNKIDSTFFPEFITSIFYNKKSPLHDGAIIVRDWRIASLSSYLPMTRRIINVEYGARHRAAFGICEKFDCFAFVVSETNGNITAVHLDDFKRMSQQPEKLVSEIAKIFASSGIFNSKKKTSSRINLETRIEEFNKSKA